MADIELVIKIPEDVYKQFKKDQKEKYISAMISTDIIANGISLPKGHGRLMIVSEDALKREQTPLSFSCQNWISEVGLSNATVAIIDADKEDRE